MTIPELLALPAMSLLQAPVRPDTLVAVAAPLSGIQAWVRLLADIATILIALALIGMALAAIAAVLKLRQLHRRMGGVAQRMQMEVRPMLKRAEDLVDNVNYVSSSIRRDVEQLRRTIDGAQDRLTRASKATEKRVREFNALMKIVQEEAESLFIGTASTLRGVRVGVERLQESEPEADWLEEIDGDELATPRPRRRHNQ